ncbi:MAG: exodeoxyribonuclease V subunit gamma [Marinicellaceae bacterium]
MINLYTDISYKNLYIHLLKLLVEQRSTVFAETWIVVPNHSAKQWLQKSLSRDLGICAQIRFIMPLSFNWEIIKNVANQEHEINIFSKDVLRWQIYDFILNDKKYSFLKKDSDIKNFNLAEKIASTLLQYNEEHPEIIAQWDSDIYEVPESQQWQVEMWLQLQENLPTKSPVELLELFNPHTDFKQQPANIFLFATEQLSSLQKATILKLSDKKDIHFLITNPCPDDYWFDSKPQASKARNQFFNSGTEDIIEVGNPLLSNLGFNKMALFDAFLQEHINIFDGQNQYTGNGLLHSLKKDIYNLQQQPTQTTTDRSLIIHSCHNRKRELEVIKDDILRNLQNDTSLNPENIIVVAPDINQYVQKIKQVFDSESSQYLPFYIDRVQLADNPYIVSLMGLLNSFNQEMTATVIYQLLSQSPILQKFNIKESDLPRIKNWILNSNIRNFYSKEHKKQLGFEAKVGNTWQFGKNRWIAGYLAGDEENVSYLSTFGDIAGQEDILAACFEFLDLWYYYYLKAQVGQSTKQWFEFVTQICQSFLYNEISEDFEKKILDQLENKLISQSLQNNYAKEPEVPLVVLNAIVETVITENNFRSEGQIGIRFQSWENAFLVEAKLVVVLGLNDNEFPQKHIKNDLDIFSKKPARLNKSKSQRDKNLMLTALTESAKKLILTYVGFDEKTNDPQPPSVVLAELISYLKQKTNNGFKVIEHKMHGYHKDYFSDGYNSFHNNYYQLAQSFYHQKQSQKNQIIHLKIAPEYQVKLLDLMNYFADPLQYFLKNSAHINYSIFEEVLKDTETYQLSGLESWQLKHEIFNQGLFSAYKTGIVSDNKVGQTILNKTANALKPLIDLQQEKIFKTDMIDTLVADTKIIGQCELDENNCLTSIYPGKKSTKNLCKHWIKHLCFESENPSFVYFEDKSFKFEAMPDKQLLLMEIIEQWKKSFDQPWLFCPPAYLNIKSYGLDLNNQTEYLKKFKPNQYTFPSDGQIYFAQKVEGYNEEKDISIFLSPMIESIKNIS